jgi:sirohydrochlorin cobaltochelatase
MKTIKQLGLLLALGVFCFFSTNAQGVKQNNTGILLVTFGTSYANARHAFDNIQQEVKEAFPDKEIRWAYTSNFIRRKLAKQGQVIDSPAEALARFASDGYTHIAVQSLHVIPGFEYENLRKTVAAFNHMPKNAQAVLLGNPLLFQHADMETAVKALSDNLPIDLEKEEAVLMMGHGTHHQSNIYYAGMQYYLWQHNPAYYLATVEGYPALQEVISMFKEKGVKKVWLTPFMTVAGDHAQNDMAGDESDSWKAQLEAQGYEVELIMKGLAEYDDIVNIWIDHLKGILHELEK